MEKTIEITIRGKVQGVFYRKFCQQAAQGLGLKGTVRNSSDGAVVVVAEGSEEKLNALVEWCKRGSPLASVSGITMQDLPPGGFTGFSILK